MRTYLVRIPHRKGHSIQRDVLLASAIAGPNRRIHGPTPNISASTWSCAFYKPSKGGSRYEIQ